MASGGDSLESEYRLASVFYQILNRRAADGSAYISVSTCTPQALHAAPTCVSCRQMGAMHAAVPSYALLHVARNYMDTGGTQDGCQPKECNAALPC